MMLVNQPEINNRITKLREHRRPMLLLIWLKNWARVIRSSCDKQKVILQLMDFPHDLSNGKEQGDFAGI